MTDTLTLLSKGSLEDRYTDRDHKADQLRKRVATAILAELRKASKPLSVDHLFESLLARFVKSKADTVEGTEERTLFLYSLNGAIVQLYIYEKKIEQEREAGGVGIAYVLIREVAGKAKKK